MNPIDARTGRQGAHLAASGFVLYKTCMPLITRVASNVAKAEALRPCRARDHSYTTTSCHGSSFLLHFLAGRTCTWVPTPRLVEASS